MKMMMRTVTLPSTFSFLLEPNDLCFLNCPRSAVAAVRVVGSGKICCMSKSNPDYPKRNGFNRHSIDRLYEELPLIQKTSKEIVDHCLTLEGDPCLSCWRGFSELHDLEKELPKNEVERVITASSGDGIESMISSLHFYSASYRRLKESSESTNASNEEKTKKESNGSAPKALNREKTKEEPKYVPEWMPKSIEELEEEEKARMADSPHARLLRAMKAYNPWYIPRPDHDWN